VRARETTAPLVKFSLFAIVTTLATLLLAATIANIRFTPTHTYTAVFTDATGLIPDDDVRVAGVQVGTVTDVRVKDRDLAQVTFTVSSDRPLLTSTHAVIRYRNLVGSRYLALTEGTGDGSVLPSGGEIPLSHTQPALDLTALFNGFKPLFAALSPNDVNQLASELITTLQGEGGSVDSLLAHTAQLTSTLADSDQVIGSVIDNLNGVLAALTQHSGAFSELLDQLQRLVSGLAADRVAIGDSLSNISDLAGATSGLLAQGRPALKDDIAQLATLAGTLNDNQQTVQGVLQRLPGKLNAVIGTASYGSWFNFYLCDFDGRIVLPKTQQVITPDFHVDQARCGQ
jgi:phospholipid/cholesterol/gamma-HCH transport system substrate-binding protein